MSIINMVNNIKDLFPDYILLIKIGKFYEVYNKDSYIIAYLFRYKLRTMSKDNYSCGFPLMSLNRILTFLENKNINYLIVDKSNNYEETDKMDYKKKNKYNEIYENANKYIMNMNRIDKICRYLNNNPKKIFDVEKIIYEG